MNGLTVKTSPLAKVLLIEDNPDDACLLREALNDFGDESIELVHAENLDQAAALISQGHFEVILLDLSLPDSQGIDTVLRAQAHAGRLPIVVLTGLSDDNIALQALRAGAQDYLVKGDINGRMLVRSIRYASERKQAYEQLSRLAEDLTRANRIKDEFLSIMSHELKSPLIAITGYAQLLESDGGIEESFEHVRAARVIRQKSDELLKMIQTILEVVNIESGKAMVVTETVCLEEFIAAVAKTYSAPTKNNVAIRWECLARNSRIVTDGGKLKQALQSLIDNAIKFTNEGQIVTSVRVLEETSSVEFSVQDTGVGIPSDVLPVIFDKFRQADSSDSRNHEGMGLGLYFVKELAKMLHATIAVQSELGIGSKFMLTIHNCMQPATQPRVGFWDQTELTRASRTVD